MVQQSALHPELTLFSSLPLRENISFSSLTERNRKIRELCQLHDSDYVYLPDNNSTEGSFDVTFFARQGFLLGETIQQLYSNPANLIWCGCGLEPALGQPQPVALVVIIEQQIHLDLIDLPLNEVGDYLLPYLTGEQLLTMVCDPELPIYSRQDKEKAEQYANTAHALAVDKNRAIISTASANLPANLSDLARFQYSWTRLQPVETVLSAQKKQQRYLLSIILGLVLSTMLVFIIWEHFLAPPEVIQPAPVIHIDPLAPAYAALRSPAPIAILTRLQTLLAELTLFSDWQLSSLNYTASGYRAEITGSKQQITPLLDTLRELGFKPEILDRDKVALSLSPEKNRAQGRPPLLPAEALLINLIDQLHQLEITAVSYSETLPPAISSPTPGGKPVPVGFKQYQLQIQLHRTLPDALNLLAAVLTKIKTVTIEQVNLKPHHTLSLSGNIQLSLYGR